MLTNPLSKSKMKRWADGAIVYQVYPRSFYDANDDGVGDIPGVTKKLDYLKEIGVNAIWLSPFYPSPMADFGYDVADYCDVDPIFGKLEDMDKLIKSAHARKIKIMIDLVPNHSSDEHVWFQESRKSRDNKFSDWYVWRDPKAFDKDGKPIPPNNWLDIFTGKTAWEWEPGRQQFYLHSFDVKQPDLNWANPEVREAIKQAMRFWLERGVDGFRVDAVRFMGKDPDFTDNPKNPHYVPGGSNEYGSLKHVNSQGWPQLFDYLAEMAKVLLEEPFKKFPRFMVTESYPETPEPVSEYLEFYKAMMPEVAAPFNFEGLGLPWEAAPWRIFLNDFHTKLDNLSPYCVASYAFGNHDKSRLVNRLGDQAARSVAVMLLTLPGMAFIYNGDEIGMQNGKIPQNLMKDPAAAGGFSRDPQRTPLQWSDKPNAGFSKANVTWLPVNDDYPEKNVKNQRRDPASILTLYRKLGQLRNKSDAIKKGKFEIVDTDNENVLAYKRSYNNKGYVTIINFSSQTTQAKLPTDLKMKSFFISSDAGTRHKKVKHQIVELLPYEAAVFSCK